MPIRTTRTPLAICTALVMTWVSATVSQEAGRDYPQWRGRDRDGSASAFVEPAMWPDALTRQWKVDVGEGYSTPVVVGDTVYVFARRNGNEVMTALDATTGRERWHTGYTAPYEPDVLAAAHGVGPKATPLFHQGRLFSLGMTGIVSAFDAGTGRLLWQTPAADEHPTYGMSVSPVAEGNLVMVHPGNHGPLTAFDAKTGAVRWSAPGRASYASPIVTDLQGVRQVVTMTANSVLGVSMADGTRLWEHAWPARGTPSAITPTRYEDTIIVGSQGMGVMALRPTVRGGAWSVDVVWETTEVSLFLSNPVLVDHTLFGLSEKARGQYFALDADTGAVLWLGPPRQAENTAVVKAGRLLFLLNDDGELMVERSRRDGFDPVARYSVATNATWAQPAISGNRIFVKDVSSLTLWTLE
ncbi:MAG: PQQ-binding-like beta-propeller repeat protein [Vicinamibacterales bacterium]